MAAVDVSGEFETIRKLLAPLAHPEWGRGLLDDVAVLPSRQGYDLVLTKGASSQAPLRSRARRVASSRSSAATSSREVSAAAIGIGAMIRSRTASSRAFRPPRWPVIGTTKRPSISPTASFDSQRSRAACTI